MPELRIDPVQKKQHEGGPDLPWYGYGFVTELEEEEDLPNQVLFGIA